MKIQNTRKCIVTGEKTDKEKLIRVVKTKNNEYFVDDKLGGRGAYISVDIPNLDVIVKKKVLNKAFKTEVPREVYDMVLKKIEEVKNVKR